MAMTAAGAPGARAKPAGNTGDAAARAGWWAAAIVWQVYATLLAGPARLLVPEHTRDAAFQLWCDLRTNVPKNQKWAGQRLSAFKPRTLPGWIAMGAFAGFASAAACALLCCALLALLSCAIVATSIAVGFAVVAGLAVGAATLFLAGCLFVASLVSSWLAACTLAGYCWLSVVITTSKFVYARLRWLVPSQRVVREGQEDEAASEAPSASTDSAPVPPATPQHPGTTAAPAVKQAAIPKSTPPANARPPASNNSDTAEPAKATSGNEIASRNASKAKGMNNVQRPELPSRVPQPVT